MIKSPGIMKRILFFCLLHLSIGAYTTLHGQPDTVWTKTYGGVNQERGISIIQTSDGGYLTVGSKDSRSAGELDLWLLKINSEGILEWEKTYGGTKNDWGYDVLQTDDGGYMVTGSTASFGSREYDLWVICLDVGGDSLWSKTFENYGEDYGLAIQPTDDGGFIIVGNTRPYTPDNSLINGDVWLLKFNNEGDTVWTQTYELHYDDIGHSVKQTIDGGYVVAVASWNHWDSSMGNLVKTDGNGNVQWIYSDSMCTGFESVQLTSDGNYLALGTQHGNWDGENIALHKIDTDGKNIWKQTFIRSDILGASALLQTEDGGYAFIGYHRNQELSERDICLIKTDSNGEKEWMKVFDSGVAEYGKDFIQTVNGSYIVLGLTYPFGSGVESDVWIIKTGETGTSMKEESDQMHIKVYPSPTISTLFVETEYTNQFSIHIQAISGQLIFYTNSIGPTAQIDLSSFHKGVYFITIRTKDFITTKKIIKL